MQGHIRQRSPNSFEIKWYIGIDENTGKKQYRTKNVKGSRKDAERELRRVLSALDSGTYIEPQNLKVSEGLEKWLEHKHDRVGYKTIQEYEKITRNYLIPALGKYRLDSIKPAHIEDYLNHAYKNGGINREGLSHRTLTHHREVLRQAFEYLVDMELLNRNPINRHVEVPGKVTFKAQRLSLQELVRLLEVAKKSKYYIPVLIAVYTGCRRGEVLALRWCDVDFNSKTISISRALEQTKEHGIRVKEPKTEMSNRVIPVGSVLIDELRQHKEAQNRAKQAYGEVYEDNDLICADEIGRMMNPSNFSRHFSELLNKAQVKHVRLHDVRHSHLSALDKHVSLKVLSSRAGHSTIKTTADIYLHPEIEEGREAAQKFDELITDASKSTENT